MASRSGAKNARRIGPGTSSSVDEPGVIALAALMREQRRRVSERAEVEPPGARRPRRHVTQRVALPAARGRSRRSGSSAIPRTAEIGRTSTVWLASSNGPSTRSSRSSERTSNQPACGADMLEILRPAEQLEELDRVRGPAGDVARELLEHRQRALAPAVVDRLGHVGARADRDRRPQVGAAQVGEQRPRRVRRRRSGSGRTAGCSRRGRRCTGSPSGGTSR